MMCLAAHCVGLANQQSFNKLKNYEKKDCSRQLENESWA